MKKLILLFFIISSVYADNYRTTKTYNDYRKIFIRNENEDPIECSKRIYYNRFKLTYITIRQNNEPISLADLYNQIEIEDISELKRYIKDLLTEGLIEEIKDNGLIKYKVVGH